MTRSKTLITFFIFFLACTMPTYQDAMTSFKSETGLHEVTGEQSMLEGSIRNYPVLFRAEMGDVWGRYAARIAIGEVGRTLGHVGRFLSGSHEYVGPVVGSPLDRVLSQIIGQPLTFFVVLKHGKPNASRLDILSDFAKVGPDDPQPKQAYVGFKAGNIYSGDPSFASRISSDKVLMDKLSEFRTQYIRVDDKAITFIFSGSENDWSAMIREQGGYGSLVKNIMNLLADIADRI